MLRATASSRPIACSAAETMFEPGALATMIPRRVASATSTLSTPVPARPITVSRSARDSSSASTAVALRTIRASYSPIRRASSAASISILDIDVEPLAEQIDSGLGDPLLDQHAGPGGGRVSGAGGRLRGLRHGRSPVG